ncbi:Segregation and condensation protein A [Burkholderiales bacterium]|nr:MAG: segregation/condensation protein A [Burkholderiales bacterium]CAG0968133.1 Segregation and condensation protein A [Burkholderiales bacterium]
MELEIQPEGTSASPSEPLPHAFAKVRGEPLLSLPTDLYIPPEALEVFLETFEGPLDLLLYLIRKQNLDVLDIPMADLTRQYLSYVELMRQSQLELAAEYLLMAAMLIEIKSRMLLPRPVAAEHHEEDPRAELVRRLLEYEQMKLAARGLDEHPLVDRDFSVAQVWFERIAGVRLPEVQAEDLKAAWAGLIARASANRHHLITREQLSVRAQMIRVLKVLEAGGFVEFTRLFAEHATVPQLVVTFLAILELAKEGFVDIAQAEPFAAIYVQLKSEPLPQVA